MKIFDLTQMICESMQVYPGTEAPKLTECNSYSSDGFRETLLRMSSHTGTHMDAPAHMNPDAKTLDEKPVSDFCGKAYVLDCRDTDSISLSSRRRFPAAVHRAGRKMGTAGLLHGLSRTHRGRCSIRRFTWS